MSTRSTTYKGRARLSTRPTPRRSVVSRSEQWAQPVARNLQIKNRCTSLSKAASLVTRHASMLYLTWKALRYQNTLHFSKIIKLPWSFVNWGFSDELFWGVKGHSASDSETVGETVNICALNGILISNLFTWTRELYSHRLISMTTWQ